MIAASSEARELGFMRAVRFTRHGKPDVLTIAEIPDLALGADGASVRIEAASINPSDVENVQGLMEQTTLPRTPGRDFAGSWTQDRPR